MEKLKHTPGPWFIEENVNHYPFIMANDNNTVAMLFETRDGSLLYGRTLPETKANAKLIAAAPELLDALKFISEQKIESETDEDSLRNIIYLMRGVAIKSIKKATE